MLLAGFESTVSSGERPQIYALDRAATGIGFGGIVKIPGKAKSMKFADVKTFHTHKIRKTE